MGSNWTRSRQQTSRSIKFSDRPVSPHQREQEEKGLVNKPRGQSCFPTGINEDPPTNLEVNPSFLTGDNLGYCYGVRRIFNKNAWCYKVDGFGSHGDLMQAMFRFILFTGVMNFKNLVIILIFKKLINECVNDCDL